MKHTLFIFAILTASIQTFAQSPRIKLNQITKDSVTGSVLISSPTDSGMVYSRDLFISYGADTVLILGGDTLAATSGIISSVLSDGVTITGDGTSGSELTADTSVLATLKALSDSLALVISSVTADNVTITGDGTVGSPLKVDTATVVSSVGRLLDSLVNVRTDLDLKQDQLNGTGFVKASGTTITYDNSTYLTSEVDGSVTNEIQDISTSGAAGNISISSGSTLNLNVDDADASASNELQTLSYNSSTNEITLSDGGGTEDLSNLDLVDSTRINSTGDTAYYYQNGVLIGTGAIAGGGGGTTYNNISETADTVYISDYLDVDTATLYVDATNNRVGIGTSTPQAPLSVAGNIHILDVDQTSFEDNSIYVYNDSDEGSKDGTTDAEFSFFVAKDSSGSTSDGPFFAMRGNDCSRNTNQKGAMLFQAGNIPSATGDQGMIRFISESNVIKFLTGTGLATRMTIENDGDVVIPQAYSELISGTTRDLYIKDDGTLGYISSTVKSKININPLNDIDFIYDLNPVTFNYRKQDEQGNFTNEYYDKTSYGLIAEEVESVADYMVYYDETEEGNVAVGINYSELITPLLKAIQDQKTEIETLKTLITELSNRLTILENN